MTRGISPNRRTPIGGRPPSPKGDFFLEETIQPAPNITPDNINPGPIDIDVDFQVVSPLNGAHPKGWGAISGWKRQARAAVSMALVGVDIPSWPRFFVTLERISPRPLDDDNCVAGFKPMRDEIASWLGLDDADPRVEFSYRQRVARVRDERVKGKLRWRSYARIVIGPTPEVAAREHPELDIRRIDASSVLGRPRRWPDVPDVTRGKVLGSRELPIRARTSRLGIDLLTNPRNSSGLQAGDRYIRISVFWDSKAGEAWRSQGCTVRLHEVDAVCEALQALKRQAEGGG